MKRIIVFSGPPCSGKSTLGAKLSTTRSIPHLELDAIRARILPNSRHSREDYMTTHRTMHLVAEVFLDLDMSVIVNAAYDDVLERRDLEELAARLEAPLFLIECRVTTHAAILRNARHRDQDPAHLLPDESVLALVNAFPYYGRGLVVDSTEPLADCMAEIDQYLQIAKPLVLGKWSAGIPIPLPLPLLEKDQAKAAVQSATAVSTNVTSLDSRRRG